MADSSAALRLWRTRFRWSCVSSTQSSPATSFRVSLLGGVEPALRIGLEVVVLSQ
jgi:hypothetical protein